MIRYLLDTDVVSRAGKSKSSGSLLAWLRTVDDQALAISVITVRERLEGVEKARQKSAPRAPDIAADVETMIAAFEGRILPIDEAVARYWAKLLVPDRSKVDDKGQIAIAAAFGLTLVSLNAKDMEGRGVPVLNPNRRPPKLYPA